MAEIRPSTLDDLPGVFDLGQAVLPVTYDPIDPEYGAYLASTWWSEESLAGSLANIEHWVAVENDEVVGVANLGYDQGRAVMWQLYVHPTHHGRGVASDLLDAVTTAAEGPLTLDYLDGNDRARAFYLKHGFVETHRASSEERPHLTWVWMRRPA